MIENLYLEDFTKKSNYLYSYPFPTGAGKTHSLFNAIKNYSSNSNNNIFIYIVPFKNLFKNDYKFLNKSNIKIIRLYSNEDIFNKLKNNNKNFNMFKLILKEIDNINNLKKKNFLLKNILSNFLNLNFQKDKDLINQNISFIKYHLIDIFNEDYNFYKKYSELYNIFFPLLQIENNNNYLIESTYDKIYYQQYYLKNKKIVVMPSFIVNFYLLGNFKYKLFLDESKIGYEKLLDRNIENFGSEDIEIVYIINQIYKFYNDIKNYSKIDEDLDKFINAAQDLLNKKEKFFKLNYDKNYIRIENKEIEELFKKKYLFYIENQDNFSSNIKDLLENYYIIRTNKDYLLLTQNKQELKNRTKTMTLYEYLLHFKDILIHFFNKTEENNEYIKKFLLNNNRTSFYNNIYNLYNIINNHNIYIEDKLLEYKENKKEIITNILNLDNFINNNIYHFNFSILNNSLINSLILEINNINNFPEKFIIKNILNNKFDIKIWFLSASLEIESNLKDFSKRLLKKILKDKFITINNNIKDIIHNINNKRIKKLTIKNIEEQDLSIIDKDFIDKYFMEQNDIMGKEYKKKEILNTFKSIEYIINNDLNSGLIFLQSTRFLKEILQLNKDIFNYKNYKIIIYNKDIKLNDIIKQYEKIYKIIIISDYINLGQGINIEINNQDIECISFASSKYYYLEQINYFSNDNQKFKAKLNILKGTIFLEEDFSLEDFEEKYVGIYQNYEKEYKNHKLANFLLIEKYKESLNNLLQSFGRCERKDTPNFLHVLYSNDVKKEIINIRKFVLNSNLEKLLSKNFINFINYFKNIEINEQNFYGIENFYKNLRKRIEEFEDNNQQKELLIDIGNSLRSINIFNNPKKYYEDLINLINKLKPELLKNDIKQDLNITNIFNKNNKLVKLNIDKKNQILKEKNLIKFENNILTNEILLKNQKLYIEKNFFNYMRKGNIGEEVFKNYIKNNDNIKDITEDIFKLLKYYELYELVDFYIIYNNILYLIDIKNWKNVQLKQKNSNKILKNIKIDKIKYRYKLKDIKLVYINIFKEKNMNYHKYKEYYETYLIDENNSIQKIENILK